VNALNGRRGGDAAIADKRTDCGSQSGGWMVYAMQCNAMQCNAMQCNAMQCNAMHELKLWL
jgi:hypothetical protein